MKKLTLLFTLLAVMGLGVSCDRGIERDEMEREEIGEEFGHEMDEMGDNIEDAGEEVVD
jgi:hypothetical protein